MKQAELKRILCLLLLILTVLPLAMTGCSDKESSDKLSVVTTVFPPYDFARAVGGENISLSMLLSPGEEVHSYEPSPKDIITIRNCDLLLCIGGESEAWVDSLIDSIENPQFRVLRLISCVDAVAEETVEGMESVDEAEEENEVELDEHIWTSPKNAVKMLEAIYLAVAELDQTNKSVFEQNYLAYRAQLETLDADFAALFADYGEIVVADRFPFRYLADAYGVKFYAAYPGCSNDAEPSAYTVKFLVDLICEKQIPVVYTIEFSNGKLADILCESCQCRKKELHSCHNLSLEDFNSGVTYLDLMRRNLTNLQEAKA